MCRLKIWTRGKNPDIDPPVGFCTGFLLEYGDRKDIIITSRHCIDQVYDGCIRQSADLYRPVFEEAALPNPAIIVKAEFFAEYGCPCARPNPPIACRNPCSAPNVGLGDKSNDSRKIPVGVKIDGKSLKDVTLVAGGYGHSFALKRDGTLRAWGRNDSGQLGDGTTDKRLVPVNVFGLVDIVAVAAGSSHSLALKNGGTVYACGGNGSGQLGDGTNEKRTAPVIVPGLTNVNAIAAGSAHSLALKNDGSVWAWGGNDKGQLGDNSNETRTAPVQVKLANGQFLANIVAIAAGRAHSLALSSNGGVVYAWGDNLYGQLGDGNSGNGNSSKVAIQVRAPGGQPLGSVTSIAASNHSLARKTDGSVWAWGKNGNGQLGDNSTTDRPVPVQVQIPGGQFLAGITSVAAGGFHSLAIKSDATAWAWGANDSGQLGDNSNTQRLQAVQVKTTAGTFLTGATVLSGGLNHSLARKSDGTAWAWGDNGNGQLGDGTKDPRRVAAPIQGMNGVFPSVAQLQAKLDHPLSQVWEVGRHVPDRDQHLPGRHIVLGQWREIA